MKQATLVDGKLKVIVKLVKEAVVIKVIRPGHKTVYRVLSPQVNYND